MYDIQIKWLTVTCFEMKFGDITIVSDPFIGQSPFNDLTYEDIENCDIITLSHTHFDHVTDIPNLMRKFPAKLLCGTLAAMPMLEYVDCNPSRIYPMDSNLELDFTKIKIKALFGRHTTIAYNSLAALNELFDNHKVCQQDKKLREMQILGSLEYRNFLITYNGVKVLIWGNDIDEVQKNMVAQLKPDICILQFSRQKAEDVAELAYLSGCKVLIPHHMDLVKTKEEYMPSVLNLQKEFYKRVPDGRFIIPENGQWIDL